MAQRVTIFRERMEIWNDSEHYLQMKFYGWQQRMG